jgi:hypothetical protein
MIVAAGAAGLALALFRPSRRSAEQPSGRSAEQYASGRPGPPGSTPGPVWSRSAPGLGQGQGPGPGSRPGLGPEPVPGPGWDTSEAPRTSGPVSTVGPTGPVSREPGETAVQLLPLPSQGGGNSRDGAAAGGPSWWDAAQGAPPAPSAGAQRTPAPDLSTYLASTFIAQCPRCGAFRLDIGRAASGWDFRCESCEYVWTWQPGTPWPPVRVMPGRRKEPGPPTP